MSDNLTPAETVRFVEEGKLCQGILFTNDLDEVVKPREKVVEVKDNIKFKDTLPIHVIQCHEFKSKIRTKAMESNIDKHIANRSTVAGENVWGVSIESMYPMELDNHEGNYLSCLHYQLIPARTVHLDPNDLELRPEVITKLKDIETSLKEADYVPSGHFEDFIEKYGSHINHGTVKFGGMLVSTAYCEGFREEDRSKFSAAATEASEAALLYGFSKNNIHPGIPFNAYEVLGGLPGISEEDLQKITVILKVIGGPDNVAEKDEWKKQMSENTSLWRVICRNSPPKPIWKLLVKYEKEFDNCSKLETAMVAEWRKMSEGRAQVGQIGDTDQAEHNGDTDQAGHNGDTDQAGHNGDIGKVQQHDSMTQVQDDEMTGIPTVREKKKPGKPDEEDANLEIKIREKAKQMTKEMKSWKAEEEASHLHNTDVEEAGSMRGADELRRLGRDMRTNENNTNTNEKVRDDLRRHVKEWLQRYGTLNKENVYCSIKDLADLRVKYDEKNQHWRQDVLDLRDVRKNISWTAQYVDNTSDQTIKNDLQTKLETVLNPFEKIEDYKNEARYRKSYDQLPTLEEQLSFIQNNKTQFPKADTGSDPLDPAVQNLLSELNMEKYYPQKLKFEDVIKLTSQPESGSNKRPSTLAELPWFFIRNIIRLNSDTRENSHVMQRKKIIDDDNIEDSENDTDDNTASTSQPTLAERTWNYFKSLVGFNSSTQENRHERQQLRRRRDDTGEDSEESDSDDDIISAVHLLDLIYIVFLCADDFLRQELCEKMAKCQYAVPFILPPLQDSSCSLILHWGLKSMMGIFLSNGKAVNETMVDVEAPLVTWMNTGKEISWKSKLLNKMLSPQQETFWHQGLTGGNCKQRISKGMVEVAWFLPGNQEDNKFPYPVTFANVRERALHSDVVCEQLHEASSITCIFAEDIDEELMTVLGRMRDTLQRVLVIVLYRSENKKGMRNERKLLQTQFELTKRQIICKQQDDANFMSVYDILKESLMDFIQMNRNSSSLSAFTNKATENSKIERDGKKCYVGQMAAESILKDIDDFNMKCPKSAKAKILPCQSDLKTRKDIAALDKEFCRQKKLKVETKTMQKYAYEIKAKKMELQKKQIQIPISDSFKYFLQCLHSLELTDRKYFLQYLKIGLNQRSVRQLQPLHDEYEKVRAEDDSSERDAKLKALDTKLSHGSLGTEHFFREMAILYENINGLNQKSNELEGILASLAQVMAEVLLDGTAIEIMDGDAVDVPVAWLSAVMNKVEDSITSTLFKVSALGAQSCGKSTLLNTMFGLNFPVSSGRCTRGAYMQLVKVDESLKKILNCDYLAVIDSEGLMSRSKTDDSHYDNELSTFIIGLSDLTLVIIKGEGNEMQDVLPMAIHVFMRMNIVGEYQACHFVHQNMGAVDVMTKVATEIDAFVRDLNEKTEAAAKDVDQLDKYKKFSDVLYYDANTDNTYVQGLWDGSLPMAKINLQYSQMMQKIKTVIIKHITKMQDKQKKPGTFEDLKERLKELWEAIKYENFVLSFKNVLAVEAHKKLAKIFDDEQWSLKREIREMIQQEENKIENEITRGNTRKTVEQSTKSSSFRLNDVLSTGIANIEARILHYFNCPGGCKSTDCKDEVKNRHLLANNEKEFKDEVRFLKLALESEIDSSMETLERKLTTEKRIRKMNQQMDQTLKEKVQEAIRTRKTHKNLTKKKIEKIFEAIWKEATGDILRKTRYVEYNPNIVAVVQGVTRRLLGTDDFLYVKKYSGRDQSEYMTNRDKFVVNGLKHMKAKQNIIQRGIQKFKNVMFSQSGPSVSDADIRRLQMESKNIIEHTKKHYTSQKGKLFNEKHVDVLFKDVKERIDGIEDETFKTTKEYKVDLMHHIEQLAVSGFTEMHFLYQRDHSPEALLEQKKKSYHDFFCVEMGHGNAAVTFCENVLKEIILKNINEQLSCTELLHTLRVHCDMFRDIKSIQAAIMIDLYKGKESNNFLEYIIDYEGWMKRKMEIDSIRCLAGQNQFIILAQTTSGKIIKTVREAVERIADSTGNETFTKALFTELESLNIPYNDTAAFLDLEVPDKKQFGGIIQQELKGAVEKDIIKTIKTWDVVQKLEEKCLTDFLFTEVVGCTATCPFCKVPCDAHSGGKTQGNHSATLHRPEGLGGYLWTKTHKLATEDCCSSVASDETFRNDVTNNQSQPFKEYHKWYPSWTIHGNADPDVEKYWKWVLAKYNKKFAKYYDVKEAEVPDEWAKFTIEQIKKDIEDNYHITIDMDKLQ